MATEKVKTPTFKVIPNTERLIIRLLKAIDVSQMGLLIPGQLKAGDALHCGEIVHPGDTQFKVGQIVYYSEYSASKLVNIGSVLRGEQSFGEALKTEGEVHVVSADDVMAYESEVFDWERKSTPEILPANDNFKVSKIIEKG